MSIYSVIFLIQTRIFLFIQSHYNYRYAFMAYNVCAKMTIFHNLDVIDAGVEMVPMKHMADQMSTGVSYFEQIKWDLSTRGVGDIDIPVIVMGLFSEIVVYLSARLIIHNQKYTCQILHI